MAEESETCKRAFQASLELIKEKCGTTSACGGKTVLLEEVGATLPIPEDVEKLISSNPALTKEQRITAVSEIPWAKNWAAGMCKLVSPELTGAEREHCINRLARKLAERVV